MRWQSTSRGRESIPRRRAVLRWRLQRRVPTERGGVSDRTLDIVFIGVAIFAALGCGYYYVLGVIDRDRALARLAAGGFLLFIVAAVLYYWMIM